MAHRDTGHSVYMGVQRGVEALPVDLPADSFKLPVGGDVHSYILGRVLTSSHSPDHLIPAPAVQGCRIEPPLR